MITRRILIGPFHDQLDHLDESLVVVKKAEIEIFDVNRIKAFLSPEKFDRVDVTS